MRLCPLYDFIQFLFYQIFYLPLCTIYCNIEKLLVCVLGCILDVSFCSKILSMLVMGFVNIAHKSDLSNPIFMTDCQLSYFASTETESLCSDSVIVIVYCSVLY